MPDSDEWLGSALAYRPTVYEYCQLALRPTLDQAAAERMGEILQRAEAEPLLNFLIDEADGLVARLQPCLGPQNLHQQQRRLQAAIDTLWVNELLTACGPCSRPSP
ncbi:hypothetical protein VB780_15675 [Leptolyngbya sp. CCNP1308]|uniref:hypothetical protein n=1 Tax=Leptolyngbya sp. CCNP1308 TaxID=3110255 RepID=UPI002B214782|nr:hypothetical protein [Leptolyngbya sp. CCNP1308]MEA5450020.1 hypothetical protein [Leptolyngbya sp. CCNP1308]